MSEAEEGDEGTDDTGEETEQPSTSEGDDSGGFLGEEEQEILQDWLIYVTGLVAALGVAIGLNANIQDQWDHALLSGDGIGFGFAAFTGPGAFMTIGVIIFTLLGYTYAQNVDNEEQTAYKVAAVTAIVGVPVLSVIGGFLYAQPSDGSLEFVNVLVSAIASGIAAAIGSAIVIWLTEEQSPDALAP